MGHVLKGHVMRIEASIPDSVIMRRAHESTMAWMLDLHPFG